MTTKNLPTAPRVIVLDETFTDPAWLSELFTSNGPYWNQGRYLSAAGAASQMPGGANSTIGVPWYRQDWALGGQPLADGAEHILEHASFATAARQVFAGAVVRPHTVYANVQLPATGTDFGHTDVPEFRGITRDRYPVALLHIMNRSGLFGRWQLDICTAVTWLWDGPRGDFVLWTHGPDRAPERFVPPLSNRAVVSDNDRVFHAVGDFARPDGPASNDLTPTSEVVANDDGWALRDGARAIGTWPRHMVRLSVSWKAYVFRDEAAATRYDEHTDDLDETLVIDIFATELARRGSPIAASSATDESFLYAIAAGWPKRIPTPSP
ncbi:MAG TPA: hypothetical protein VM282_11090 [Acidimicrobiales bacterium]|nr:hypothetical protein [Acidimicrobiales bacterium]